MPISIPSGLNTTDSSITIQVMIAETIIVGKVPNVYVDGNNDTIGKIISGTNK